MEKGATCSRRVHAIIRRLTQCRPAAEPLTAQMCLPVLRYRPAGLSVYPSYMGGGGYVLSADLAAALVKLHTQVVPLKHTTAEDVTLAMWLLPFDGVRRVDHPGFRTQAGHCCAHEIER